MKNPNSNCKCVQITHVVSPHQFYFKYRNDCVNSEFSKFDFEIQIYGNELHEQKTYEDGYLPMENELVIFFHVIFNKWIRGEVVNIDHEITLWCIDNGISEKCTALHILPLIPRFHEDMKLVHLGGLTLLPTEKILNVHTVEVETHLSAEWDEKTKTYFKGILNTSKSFMFTEEFKLSSHKFGSLAIEISKSSKKKDINNILLSMNNVAHIEQYADADLHLYIRKEKLQQQLYHSLKNGSTIQTTMVKDALSIKTTSEISSIKNFTHNELYEDFDDSVSQVSRNSSNTSTMLETKSPTAPIIHRNRRNYEEARCDNPPVAVSNDKWHNNFDDSVTMALSSTATSDEVASTSSSTNYRRGDLGKLNDYESFMRTCRIARTKKLRKPLESTMNWINSISESTSSDTMSECSKSTVSSIVNLNNNKELSPTLSMTSSTTTNRRNMLAKLPQKETITESTNIVDSTKDNNNKKFGIPAGFAKNRLDTFGGPSNKK